VALGARIGDPLQLLLVEVGEDLDLFQQRRVGHAITSSPLERENTPGHDV
jgi:hypothetical protein